MEIKRCGQCGREVPASTRVGEKCPACGVRFDFARQSRGARRSADWSVVGIIFLVLLITLAVSLPRLISRHHQAAQPTDLQRSEAK